MSKSVSEAVALREAAGELEVGGGHEGEDILPEERCKPPLQPNTETPSKRRDQENRAMNTVKLDL